MFWRSHIPDVFDVLEDSLGMPHAIRATMPNPPSAEWVKDQMRTRYRKEVTFGVWVRVFAPLAWEAPVLTMWSPKRVSRRKS